MTAYRLISELGYTDRASYTCVDGDRWLTLRPEARMALAEWGYETEDRWRRAADSSREFLHNIGAMARLCEMRQVLPILCGARVCVPGRLIPGWARPDVFSGKGRAEALDREHHIGGWQALVGPLSIVMGHDDNDNMQRRAIQLVEWLARRPEDHQPFIEAIRPHSIHAPTDERFMLAWMDRPSLASLAVAIDAALAGRRAAS